VSPQYQVLGEHLPGGLAEKVCVPLSNLAPLPKAISYEAAAAQILVATTSWRMLVKQGKVKKGEDILVVGAGGGLNSLSIQLAKSFGLRVFCLTSSKEKEAKAKALGAEQVFNYREVPEWHKLIRKETGGRGVDIVIDNVGRETFSQSMKALRHGGRLVTVGNTSGPQIEFDNRLLFGKQLSLIGSTMGSKQDFLDALDYIWKNNLPPIIDRLVPLEHGIQEIQRLEEGRQFGKIVLLPSAS
jgi:NADPH:quinone reductase-like Zn-dependent oxidoreductase